MATSRNRARPTTHPIELLDLPDFVTEPALARMLRDDAEAELTFDGRPLWAYVVAAIVGAQEGYEKDEDPSDPGEPTTSLEACVFHRSEQAIYVVVSLMPPTAGEAADSSKLLAGTTIRRPGIPGRSRSTPRTSTPRSGCSSSRMRST